MDFFLDTEFIETESTVELISLAVVADDGRELYAISTEFDASRASPWVVEHVLAKLEPRDHPAWLSREQIKNRLLALVGDESPRFWAWGGAAYDFWALVQLFPLAERVPDGWRYTAYDISLLVEQAGLAVNPVDPRLPQLPPEAAHHALVDARWARQVHDAVASGRPSAHAR